MDAINHLPEMLTRWERFNEQTMFLHFATYDEKWCGVDDCFSLQKTYLDLTKHGVVY